jgi:hypothetical protein
MSNVMGRSKMNVEPKPDNTPPPFPAPQLPNIPASPDDPFQPDPERQLPQPPDSDVVPSRTDPFNPDADGEPANIEQPERVYFGLNL